MKTEMSQQISTEFSNIKFHEELFSVPALLYVYRWTDRAVLIGILQDVNVPQISWLDKTGKG
jgi:hypothetical protein